MAPPPVNKLRSSIERAVRAFSFHRDPAEARPPPPPLSPLPPLPQLSPLSPLSPPPHPPCAPAEPASAQPNVHSTRSFPSMSSIRHTSQLPRRPPRPHRHLKFVPRRTPHSSRSPRSLRTFSLSHNVSATPSNQSNSPPHPMSSATPSQSLADTSSLPKPHMFRRLSAHRMRSLSLGHRASDPAQDPDNKLWSSGGPALFSRSPTEDSTSWSRIFASSFDLREKARWRKRNFSYSCTDFELEQEHHIVEIGQRLPDRSHSGTEEDVFGRRRRDFSISSCSLPTVPSSGLLACDVDQTVDRRVNQSVDPRASTIRHSSLKSSSDSRRAPEQPRFLDTPIVKPDRNHKPPLMKEATTDDFDEQEAIRHITKAIGSSKGRLRKSANMSKAFTAVIRSGDGFLRKSELIQQTLNSEDSKDPSMIILLDPESCEPGSMRPEGASSASEESGSVENMKSVRVAAAPNIGFSTSMTARQCAATLETILRDMACKVSRYTEEDIGKSSTVKLRATRFGGGARLLDRKVKVLVTVREEDNIRTSVSFRRVSTMYGSRDGHFPLCSEIRERFQREWPAVVEALYIRVPHTQVVRSNDG
ncbi:unnamed protein product [Agarophyton chilense]|eukprot:gb/GEZJ01003302.1/.p1 GENE.gb/GEZJ01003302.1/~~gb/GEZJ01003302.1/.p1  ORF type:complete len:657 (-),score=72.55 gb/GEZJ01003302.1/:551-2314(-)